MKKVIAAFLALTLSLTVAGCTAQAPAPSADAPAVEATDAAVDEAVTEPEAVEAPATDAPVKMTMVTDVGGVNDESFNMLAWKGHEEAGKQFGFEVDYIESHQEADYMPNLDTAHDNGAKIIWGIGFLMGEQVQENAAANDDAIYAVIDYGFDEATMPKNLIGISFREQEPSFLVGYIAAKMSKTGKVGFIGGKDNVVIRRFHSGFEAGVKYANSAVEVKSQYVDHFNDAAAGKAAANKMYQDGLDIIFHAAGASGNGVIEAAKEQNKWVIGVDTDQNHLAPENVITSACKGVDIAIVEVAKQYKDGTLTTGKNMILGLSEGAVSIAPTSSKLVPAEIITEVDALIEDIKAGKVTPPGTEEEAKAFIANLAK